MSAEAVARTTGQSGTGFPTQAQRGDSGLAFLLLLLIPVGAMGLPEEFPIAWSYFAALLLTAICLGEQLVGSAAGRRITGVLLATQWIGLAILLLEVARGEGLNSVFAASGFFAGTVAGIFVGALWSASPERRVTWTDRALGLFLLTAAFQVGVMELSGFVSLRELHSLAVLPWGRSNYVAAIMVVASFLMIGRIQELQVDRRLFVVPAIGLLTSLVLLSRGAAIALTVGIVVMAWRADVSRGTRILMRTGGLLAIAGGFWLVQMQSALRSVDGYRADVNVDARYTLFRAAWGEFTRHPLIGSGWLHLRNVLSDGTVSYAHNLILSFLQMSGLLGALFLIVVGWAAWRGRGAPAGIVACYCACLAIAMSDPFAESLLGALFLWTALSRAVILSNPLTGEAPPARRAPKSRLE